MNEITLIQMNEEEFQLIRAVYGRYLRRRIGVPKLVPGSLDSLKHCVADLEDELYEQAELGKFIDKHRAKFHV